ncbi:hypothetical protein FO519_005190 [Halicephalobus sp. NKZ332]|nr:hypothetical protein FO519_005190 [Halicephalobus sp. NKZ332]
MPPKKQNFEELKWKAVVVGDESPRRFQRAMQSSKGWESENSSRFPMDIILSFPKPVNIWKFVVGCSDSCLPTKIEVRVGISQDGAPPEDSEEDEEKEPTYEDAKKAKYLKRSTVTFEKRHPAEKTFEAKTLFMDVIGQFVWIILYEPYEGDMVHLKELSIYGYTNIHPSPEQVAERKKRDKEVEKEAKKLEKEKEKTDSNSEKASSVANFDDDGDYKSQSRPYSSQGDGFSTSGDALGSEPLASVRLIKQVLIEKRQKAMSNDRVVEANTCKRAVERLDEYEERLVEMKKKMSQAMQAKDYDYAERYRLAMIDSRDTVFRAIHLDLLLNQDELRSLGAKSKWADPGGD